jgi:hypothetical protein
MYKLGKGVEKQNKVTELIRNPMEEEINELEVN